ncbi:hypothetical protein EDB92DRAFT_910027 [Lactarius akahatsu]|uniref:Uncharacterized protein n=1 Tax=Lactarius akahatsu TaxID=416441 RepID=A0AAD4QCQ0_9AGAM|nr:hypothetical protein EDB92DRAFT_910027 [Lactarius akahatsu]
MREEMAPPCVIECGYQLTALIRATNNNDIDNGLSSWIGRCCKRKRVQAQSTAEAVPRPAEIPTPQTHSVSDAPASIRQVSQKPTQSTHRDDQTGNTTSRDGVATPLKPDGGHPTRDLGFLNPQTPTEPPTTTLVRLTVQQPTTISLDMAAAQPERSRTMLPLPSTSHAASLSGNVTDSRPAHLREISLPLARTPPSQPAGPTYVRAHSRSFKRTSASGSVGPDLANSEPMDIDTDPPTLDLRALSLSRAPGPSKTPTPSSVFSFNNKTASRPHSPPPPSSPRPAAGDDDEIEYLYGPPSVHAPLPPREPSPRSLQPLAAPVPTEPRLLPVLAASDPRMLATLERHERREAERPRRGMRKPQAVERAGVRRGGFVLVADHRTEHARPTEPCREPRGVFASYFFARSSA